MCLTCGSTSVVRPEGTERGQICIKIIQKYSASKALSTGFVHLSGDEVLCRYSTKETWIISLIPGWMCAPCSSAVILNESRLIRNGSSCMVGQTGSIHLPELILVWEFLCLKVKADFCGACGGVRFS